MMIATRHGNFPVKKGDKLAGTRIIPLMIEEEKMESARKAALEASGGAPILKLMPLYIRRQALSLRGMKCISGAFRIPLRLSSRKS